RPGKCSGMTPEDVESKVLGAGISTSSGRLSLFVESRVPRTRGLAGLELARLWREEFGAGGDADLGVDLAVALRVAAGGEHLAVRQQREGVTVTRDGHAAWEGYVAGGRVEQRRARLQDSPAVGVRTELVRSSRDQDPSGCEHREGVAPRG